jgi:cyclase
VGGGIRDADQVAALLRAGADKVALNTGAVERPKLVEEVASRFGVQCVVASIDILRDEGKLRVATHSGSRPTERDPVEMALELEGSGAGEILLTSIDRDGTMTGYDLDLVAHVARAVTIPVIASGGAGTYEDMAAAIGAGASAVAAASIFHFTEQTPLEAKQFLHDRGIPTRL